MGGSTYDPGPEMAVSALRRLTNILTEFKRG
jgi:hypothetical protein